MNYTNADLENEIKELQSKLQASEQRAERYRKALEDIKEMTRSMTTRKPVWKTCDEALK